MFLFSGESMISRRMGSLTSFGEGRKCRHGDFTGKIFAKLREEPSAGTFLFVLEARVALFASIAAIVPLLLTSDRKSARCRGDKRQWHVFHYDFAFSYKLSEKKNP